MMSPQLKIFFLLQHILGNLASFFKFLLLLLSCVNQKLSLWLESSLARSTCRCWKEKERQKKEDTEKKEQCRQKTEELKAEIEGRKHTQEEKAKRKQVEQEKQVAEDAADQIAVMGSVIIIELVTGCNAQNVSSGFIVFV